VFTYNQCRKCDSRKRSCFWSGRAICKVDKHNCIKVVFEINDEPQPGNDVEVYVTVNGSCNHKNDEDIKKLEPVKPNRRFLKGEERIKVAEKLRHTLETPCSLYEKRLSEMGTEELDAGNTTHCQRKETFRQALHDAQKKNACTTT
jgi:hypothetical protein